MGAVRSGVSRLQQGNSDGWERTIFDRDLGLWFEAAQHLIR